MKNSHLIIILLLILFPAFHIQAQDVTDLSTLARDAQLSLEKGITFMQSLAIEGGYVYYYTLDGKEKWGEDKTDDRTIEVQPPGTPAVGMSFLRAYKATGKKEFLQAANEAASALIRGQNQLGGWEHKIFLDRPTGDKVSFDDDQTQSAISFLMALDQEIDSDPLRLAVDNALKMMMVSQLDNGGWPHQYPKQQNYHDYATFNDEGINDCIRVMIEAHEYYGGEDIKASLKKVGRFLLISQLPPPQPGWAQQYNEYLQPAWARSYEPPSVCPLVTINNMNSLIDLYLHIGDEMLLEPIPDAIRWLKASRLPNGKWGRFLELGTNRALYYDRGRIQVASLQQLSLDRRTGYGYEVNLQTDLAAVELRYRQVRDPGSVNPEPDQESALKELAIKVGGIITTQDHLGRWIVHQDKFRNEVSGKTWDGEYRIEDRISSALFNRNVATLCAFLELYDQQSKD